jgi:tRNA G37 N-methylase Trm5
MRHLSVPSHDTQRILQQLKTESALPEGARVREDPTDEGRRIIPFTENASEETIGQFPIIEVDVEPPPARTYRDHLSNFLPSDVVESTEWPTRHEFVGDLILLKLNDGQREFGGAIGEALLCQHARTRAVFEDRGVTGTFRVRALNLLAVREGEDESTRTRIVEGGHQLWTDPTTVYYSSRLSHEREGTLNCAIELQRELGRPLSICDPYAGVGPSLKPLVSELGLVGELFAGDLNPAAVEFLRDNIHHPTATIECVDALELKERTEMSENYDLLLVNIPHDSLEHLPHLMPLLRPNGIVRGWAIVEDTEFENIKEHLHNIFGSEANLEIRRSYSATANLCRFEARKARN